jgi:hypothetical protein
MASTHLLPIITEDKTPSRTLAARVATTMQNDAAAKGDGAFFLGFRPAPQVPASGRSKPFPECIECIVSSTSSRCKSYGIRGPEGQH